jgi:hypothetical protein
MINYTERITLLVDDVVRRVPRLSYIDPKRLLIFARFGRTSAEGAYATCHCVNLPPSDPGYYFWRDRPAASRGGPSGSSPSRRSCSSAPRRLII